MTSKAIFTCDICRREADGVYQWAQIHISGSSGNMGLLPDESLDVCAECWKPIRRQLRERANEAARRDPE